MILPAQMVILPLKHIAALLHKSRLRWSRLTLTPSLQLLAFFSIMFLDIDVLHLGGVKLLYFSFQRVFIIFDQIPHSPSLIPLHFQTIAITLFQSVFYFTLIDLPYILLFARLTLEQSIFLLRSFPVDSWIAFEIVKSFIDWQIRY
jgi:hypothetical protein